ncbi:MAG: hypothetical protein QNM02_01290 [Acidimicrobiia bacterium]|nr:hypothetical protein [Acidimicrobiia bacterium]
MPDSTSDARPSGPADLDYRGVRRLTGVEEWIWYLVAGISYITLGIWHKWLLNWFVGPVWLIAIVVIGPWFTDRLRLTGRSEHEGPDDR